MAAGRIFYRRRAENVGRKSGNIADFVRNWGAAYEYMIVLDADSVMSGKALVTLAQLMDAHPEVGIIQTLPLPVGPRTLFARMLQFGARLNGPMLASGLAFWQLGESNYWGHNAILRLRPFASDCGSAAPAGCAAVRRRDPEPRFRRGRLHAARRATRSGWCPISRAAGKRCPPTSSTSPRATAAGRRAICSTSA